MLGNGIVRKKEETERKRKGTEREKESKRMKERRKRDFASVLRCVNFDLSFANFMDSRLCDHHRES